MVLLVACLAGVPAALGREPRNLGRGIAREGDAVVIDEPTGRVEVAVEPGWDSFTDETSGLVILARKSDAGHTVRVLDRRGRVRGTVTAPPGWLPVPTGEGVVLVPEAPHGPARPHTLRFLSFGGAARREVKEPDLRLLTFQPARGGRFVTVSAGDAPDNWVVIAYGPAGTSVFRRTATSVGTPEALVTGDGRRLVLVEHDAAGGAAVSVFAPDRRLHRHALGGVSRLVADQGTGRVAAVGRETVALVDAESGKLEWARDEPLDFVAQGGVRFDRRAARLHVVTADQDRPRGKARLKLRSYRLANGEEERAALGETPVDEVPAVVDAEVLPGGERRVVLPDRAITTAPGAAE